MSIVGIYVVKYYQQYYEPVRVNAFWRTGCKGVSLFWSVLLDVFTRNAIEIHEESVKLLVYGFCSRTMRERTEERMKRVAGSIVAASVASPWQHVDGA